MLPKIGIKRESRQVCLQEHRKKLSRAPIDVASSDLLNALRAQSVLLQLRDLSWESYQPVHKICFPPAQICWPKFLLQQIWRKFAFPPKFVV